MPWGFLNFELERKILTFEIFPYLAYTKFGNIFSMVLKIQTFILSPRFKYLFENFCLLLLKVVLPGVFYHKLGDNTLVVVYFKQLCFYNCVSIFLYLFLVLALACGKIFKNHLLYAHNAPVFDIIHLVKTFSTKVKRNFQINV